MAGTFITLLISTTLTFDKNLLDVRSIYAENSHQIYISSRVAGIFTILPNNILFLLPLIVIILTLFLSRATNSPENTVYYKP